MREQPEWSASTQQHEAEATLEDLLSKREDSLECQGGHVQRLQPAARHAGIARSTGARKRLREGRAGGSGRVAGAAASGRASAQRRGRGPQTAKPTAQHRS
eukprot:TRINITY_DN1965_c0_g2_i3.p1 TRINITY_DN1965_c0_g2~~TRINITY_DN1965_c0_g2_i3.p1  ORF type:complete len:101 (+),score=5.77 TRINITY_DN1965_c0_g2_i3:1410-1712(+)